ncbi:MAG: hypothetical protein QGG33_08170 [Candidatus Krumholzibacteria bacterium]|nr:hypothetical protein [Candidatus Krumholzibacteria bacterium]
MRWLPGRGNEKGFSVMELMVACSLAILVMMGLGHLMLGNQAAWNWGMSKLELQQEASRVLDRMSHSLRAADGISLLNGSEFKTLDPGETVLHHYRRVASGSQYRLQENGTDMQDSDCTVFSVSANSDSSLLTLSLELLDEAGNRVSSMTMVSLRP